jgi:hypothetical protein
MEGESSFVALIEPSHLEEEETKKPQQTGMRSRASVAAGNRAPQVPDRSALPWHGCTEKNN